MDISPEESRKAMIETEEQREYIHTLVESSTFDVGWLTERVRGEDVVALHGMPEPYEGQDRIVRYLQYGGFVFCWGMTARGTVDALRCDGDFKWTCDLAQEVSRHNLRLEPEFERAVLDDPHRMSRLRRLLIEHHIHPAMI